MSKDAALKLEIIGYEKRYSDKIIISIHSINLPMGIYWLRGENGSGKTTLLKSIAGIIPFTGAITACGIDLRKQPTHYKRIVNYAEAEPLYPDFLTGEDLIRFYVDAKTGDNEQVAQLEKIFGVDGFKHNKIATYSSGMIKKLSLMLAFIGRPKVILLDEPLITLDTQAVASLQKLIQTYTENGVSFLITSHQEVTIPGHAIRLLSLENSKITLQ